MRSAFLLLALLLVTSPCFGQDLPSQPAIIGPASIAAGDIVTFSAANAGPDLVWACLPTKGQRFFLVVKLPNDTQAAIFSTKTPGSYAIVLSTAVGGKPALAIADFNVGGPVPPDPPPGPGPPPNPPDLVAAAETVACEAAMKLADRSDVLTMAGVYSGLASHIKCTANPKGEIDTPDRLITATRFARETALRPERAPAWNAWSAEVGTWLESRRTPTGGTMDVWRNVWLAIGRGLVRAK